MQLSELNIKDIANAPMAMKGVVLALMFFAIVAAGYYFYLSDQMDGLEALENEEQSLRNVYTQKKSQAQNLDIHRQQLRETEQTLAVLLKQLPNKSEIDALLTDINQAGLGRGLQFDLFRPQTATYADFYSTIPVAIKVNGSYHEIAGFISDVAHLPRIVTVHDIAMTPTKGTTLTMDATLRTYRYLDESETAELNKPAGGKK